MAGTYTITVLPAHDNVSVPRLELGISRVLGERHNQLDHTDGTKNKNGVSGFRSQYLVLAKDARFRLRQYPFGLSCGVSGFRSQYLVLAKHARFRLRQYPGSGARLCSPNMRQTQKTGCSVARRGIHGAGEGSMDVENAGPTTGDLG